MGLRITLQEGAQDKLLVLEESEEEEETQGLALTMQRLSIFLSHFRLRFLYDLDTKACLAKKLVKLT